MMNTTLDSRSPVEVICDEVGERWARQAAEETKARRAILDLIGGLPGALTQRVPYAKVAAWTAVPESSINSAFGSLVEQGEIDPRLDGLYRADHPVEPRPANGLGDDVEKPKNEKPRNGFEEDEGFIDRPDSP
jgi:hypothetical protein